MENLQSLTQKPTPSRTRRTPFPSNPLIRLSLIVRYPPLLGPVIVNVPFLSSFHRGCPPAPTAVDWITAPIIAFWIQPVPISAWLMNVCPPWITNGVVTLLLARLMTAKRSAWIRTWLW
ncbi:hypothetical protein G6F55_014391 [Rhizopus delemar]|nr:hypothetical protein G6F55_014391 [Rhizopus delemar]